MKTRTVTSRKFAAICLLTAALLMLAACAPSPAAPPPNVSQRPIAPATTSAPPTAPPLAPTATTAPPTATTAPPATPIPPTATLAALTLTDSAGRKVTLKAVPQRVISLAPSTTEIAFAVGAGTRVVGVDEFSDYPAEAKNLQKISKGFSFNYEQIVALKPDLVLAAGIISPDVIKKLEELKLAVLIIGAEKTTFDSVKDDILLAGQALGAEVKAKEVTAAMDKKIAEVKAKIANAKSTPRVYWELDATDPAKPYAPGPGSFIDDLIKLAGGVSVTASAKSPYPQVSAEEIIKANPEIIILGDAAYGTTPESVKARPGWNVIAAVKSNKVLPIDDNLVSRPGPRIVEGLEAAAKLIHPELFP